MDSTNHLVDSIKKPNNKLLGLSHLHIPPTVPEAPPMFYAPHLHIPPPNGWLPMKEARASLCRQLVSMQRKPGFFLQDWEKVEIKHCLRVSTWESVSGGLALQD